MYFVGVDLGGTNIKAGVVDAQGVALKLKSDPERSSLSVPTQVSRGRDQVVKNIVAAAEQAIAATGVSRKDVGGIGIGSPGPMSHRQGLVINPGNLPCLADTPLRDIVRDRTGIPVTLENDANAAAFGEFWAGAGRGEQDLVMWTLGTGVGGGVISEGKLIRGHFENGGELGHMIVQPGGRRCSCGQSGCLEAYSSAYNLARRAEECLAQGAQSTLVQVAAKGNELNSEDVATAAKAGDAVALKVWNEACYYLAVACVTMQHISNPKIIVMAGGLIAQKDFLLTPVRGYFRAMTWNLLKDFPEIKLATLGNDAGFIGAAGCAWDAHRTGQW